MRHVWKQVLWNQDREPATPPCPVQQADSGIPWVEFAASWVCCPKGVDDTPHRTRQSQVQRCKSFGDSKERALAIHPEEKLASVMISTKFDMYYFVQAN